jgi:hypothetical protein
MARLCLSGDREFRALRRLVHLAFQDLAVLIHLAQLALGIDFVLAVYQQVIHNQPAARANPETELNDR